MPAPREILDDALQRARAHLRDSFIDNEEVRSRIERVCRNIQNRALIRLLLACSLVKIHLPAVDIRKPYTEIGDPDAYSGRTYDEAYVTPFILEHDLPCNPTTAFLTPALRNRNVTLTPDLNLVGRPPELYQAALELLNDVQTNVISPDALLSETIRWLLIVKEERRQRMDMLLAGLSTSAAEIPLSAEAIVTLIELHLQCPGSSRLPVLVVAAAYETAGALIGEQVRTLTGHTAADRQTGTIGDVEVTLVRDDNVIAGYEMKTRRVTREDIDIALQKIVDRGIQNYIFITTDVIDPQVKEYAVSLYETTGGIEVVILDCIGFLRHFLHLFHRLRGKYVEAYQALVLAQPESAVRQPLKEAWLALRQAAESGSSN